MTTDITELAQSHELRNKVNHRLYGALEFQGTSGEHATVTLSIDECKSIIAAMDERLALVEALESKERTIQVLESSYNEQTEALEKAQQHIARQEQILLNQDESLSIRRGELEKAQAQSSKWLEAYHKAVSIGARYEERIAELESRTVTVKLPPKIERNDADGWFMYNCGRVGGGAAEWYNKALDDVGAELTAAGIKVEAE
ncbi:hypothetical protein ACMWHO_18290 [Klebsiella pneumoniae]|uniref:hypothetical protein n=1 Tax=Klebsiella pneumoniae TaxID=573 RepID=UPI0035D1A076